MTVGVGLQAVLYRQTARFTSFDGAGLRGLVARAGRQWNQVLGMLNTLQISVRWVRVRGIGFWRRGGRPAGHTLPVLVYINRITVTI